MPAGEHHSVLHLAVVEIDHFVEEKRPSRGASKSRTDELAAVRQNGVAAGAREQSRTSNVVEEDATHVDLPTDDEAAHTPVTKCLVQQL